MELTKTKLTDSSYEERKFTYKVGENAFCLGHGSQIPGQNTDWPLHAVVLSCTHAHIAHNALADFLSPIFMNLTYTRLKSSKENGSTVTDFLRLNCWDHHTLADKIRPDV